MLTLTVTQLNTYVKAILEEDSKLADIYIKAEISNFKNHFRSGHLYFNLKDDKSSVKAVMFSGYAKYLKFEPEEGMEVLVKASVSLYEVDGSFQVYVSDMQPYGVGAVEIAMRQLIQKLEKKGFFSHEIKKPLPRFPNTIGVITSKTGAVINDIQLVISRRYPIVNVKFCPTIVQGEAAPKSLINAIKTLDKKCDVIIIARGGGSKEDLWAFNDEKLAEAIFNATTPIVSAVGHETDTTICDMVSDVRASTPSVAAEIVTPSKEELIAKLKDVRDKIINMGNEFIKNSEKRIDYFNNSEIIKNPLLFIDKKEKQLDFIQKTMYNLSRRYFDNKDNKLRQKAALLESLSPFAVLKRGYAVAFKDSLMVKSVNDINISDELLIQLQDGQAEVTVNKLNLKGSINERKTII